MSAPISAMIHLGGAFPYARNGVEPITSRSVFGH